MEEEKDEAGAEDGRRTETPSAATRCLIAIHPVYFFEQGAERVHQNHGQDHEEKVHDDVSNFGEVLCRHSAGGQAPASTVAAESSSAAQTLAQEAYRSETHLCLRLFKFILKLLL